VRLGEPRAVGVLRAINEGVADERMSFFPDHRVADYFFEASPAPARTVG
jgi:hypothetical protein